MSSAPRATLTRPSKRYEEVLQVKEWKGELWPEALYSIGECLREQGKEKEAYAYLPTDLRPLPAL